MDKLGKILRNHWKENLEIRKIAKFASDTFSASDDVAAKSCENFLGVGRGGGTSLKRLMGMCRWMGSHFHDWTAYNGVSFSVELIERGCTFSDFWGMKVLHIYG